MKKILDDFITDAIKNLTSTQLALEKNKVDTLIINKDYFDEKFINEVNISEHFDEFKALKKINKPVLYWFQTSLLDNNAKNGQSEPLKTDFFEPLKKSFKIM